MNLKKTVQQFELEAFIYTHYLWVILVSIGLFFLMVYVPFEWCIEYFWGWEILNDFRYPLMKKLSIFALVSLPLVAIFKEFMIFLFKSTLTVTIDENNQISIRKTKQTDSFFTIDTIKPFNIEILERRIITLKNTTYIISFKNENNKVIHLSCPQKLISVCNNFILLQEYLKKRFDLDNVTQRTESTVTSKIYINRTCIYYEK